MHICVLGVSIRLFSANTLLAHALIKAIIFINDERMRSVLGRCLVSVLSRQFHICCSDFKLFLVYIINYMMHRVSRIYSMHTVHIIYDIDAVLIYFRRHNFDLALPKHLKCLII